MADTVSDSSGNNTAASRRVRMSSRATQASEALGGMASVMDALESSIDRTLEKAGELSEQQVQSLNDMIALQETLVKQQEVHIGATQKVWKNLADAALLTGRKTQKMLSNLTEEQQKIAKAALQEQANDLKRALPKRRQLIKAFLTDIDRDTAKQLIKNPFLNLISGFQSFRGTVAGKPLDMMVKGLKKTGKTLKKFSGDMVMSIVNLAISGLKQIQKFFTTNLFKVFKDKINELRTMFMNFPGAEQALNNLRSIQDTVAGINQQFGGTQAITRQIQEAIYAQSNALIRVEDNVRSVNAVMRAGVRNPQLVAEYMEDTARFSRALGESEESIAGILVMQRRNWQMTREESQVAMTAFMQFNRGLSESGFGYGVSMDQMLNIFTSNEQNIQRMMAAGENIQDIQRAMMVASQFAATSGVDPAALTQLMMQAGTIPEGGLLVQMLGSPAEAQRLAMRDPAAFFERIVQEWQRISLSGSTEQIAVFREELDTLGLGMLANEFDLLSNNIETLPDIVNTATSSFVGLEEAVDLTDQAVEDGTPRIDILTGSLEQLANNTMIGEYRFSEFLGVLDESSTMLSSLSGGFDMISGGMDMMFGPLSGIVKMLTTFPMMLMSIGGVFGDFTEDELGNLGLLGQMFIGFRNFKDTLWKELEPMLVSIWEGIVEFFKPGPNGERSMFAEMVHQGALWVRDHGPQIIRQMKDVAVDLLGSLSTAFQELQQDEALGGSISELFVSALEAAIPLIKGATDTFISVVEAILSTMVDVLSDSRLGPSLERFITTLVTGGAVASQGVMGALGEFGEDILHGMWGTFSGLGRAIFEGFTDAIPEGTMKDALLGGNALTRLEDRVNLAVAEYQAGTLSPQRFEMTMSRLMDRYQTLEGQGALDYGFSEAWNMDRGTFEVRRADLRRIISENQQFGMETAVAQEAAASWSRVPEQDQATIAMQSLGMLPGSPDGGAAYAFEGPAPTTDPAYGGRTWSNNQLADGSGYPWRMTAPYLEQRSDHIHHGVDLAPIGREGRDAMISSFMGGEVVMSNMQPGGYGNVVKVRSVYPDGRNVEAIYAHMADRRVEVGDKVFPGSPLGLLGSTGSSTAPHLHFEVREGENTDTSDHINPMPYLELSEGGVVGQEAFARISEGRSEELVYPLDQFNADSDERTNRLMAFYERQADRIIDAIERTGQVDSDVLLGRLMGGAY